MAARAFAAPAAYTAARPCGTGSFAGAGVCAASQAPLRGPGLIGFRDGLRSAAECLQR